MIDFANLPLDVIGAMTGIVGTITGVISLFWHISRSRPRLKLEQVYFKKEGYDESENVLVEVQLNLRNKGNSPVTIEHVYVTIGNIVKLARHFSQVHIAASSSKELRNLLSFEKKDYGELFKPNHFKNDNLEKFEVCIIHTFGKIIKKGKGDFRTGHFTIR